MRCSHAFKANVRAMEVCNEVSVRDSSVAADEMYLPGSFLPFSMRPSDSEVFATAGLQDTSLPEGRTTFFSALASEFPSRNAVRRRAPPCIQAQVCQNKGVIAHGTTRVSIVDVTNYASRA